MCAVTLEGTVLKIIYQNGFNLLILFQVKTVVGGLAGADPVTCSRYVVVKPDMSLEDAIKQVGGNM